jgi:tetratricopeptide (TPR) repeat protein
MMRVPVRSFLAAALALSAASPVFAQRGGSGMHAGDALPKDKVAAWRGNAQVSGKVTDEAGKGVGEAKVTFVFSSLNEGFFATTKKNGEFSVKDIKAGEWRVQVDAPNFVTVRQTVTVADSKNPPLALQLKRDNSPELLTKADALFKEGKNAEARAEYMKVLEAHPDLAGINRAIAFTYGRERNHPEALKYLDLALAANPDDTTLLQLAGASAMEVGDFPRAMGYFDKIEDATLADPTPLNNASVNMINKHQPADAIKLASRAIARFPEAPQAYFYRGFARLQANQKDTADARADLEKFVSLAPPDAPELPQARDLLTKVK